MDKTLVNALFIVALCIGANSSAKPLANPPSISASSGAEVHGVWLHPNFFRSDSIAAHAPIKSVLDEYLQAGINTLMRLVKTTSGDVYFRRALAPMAPAFHWDLFAVFRREAKQRHLVVHKLTSNLGFQNLCARDTPIIRLTNR